MERKWPLLLIAFISLFCVSAGKKPKILVTIHVESEENEGGKFVIPITLGGHTYYFRKVPEITNKQINSFYRFPAKNGRDWGVAFKLDSQGSARMASITSVNVGRRLLTTINMRPVSFVMIDQPVRHGYAVVWSGVTDQDIAAFSKEIPETDPGGTHKKTDNLSNDDYLRRNPDEAYDIGEKKKKKRGLFGLFSRKKDKDEDEEEVALEDDFAPLPE